MKISILVGNPKARSRTWQAAHRLAAGIGGDRLRAWDLVELGPALLQWASPSVVEVLDDIRNTDVLIVASPTFKATYSGLLKLFLDQVPNGTGLRGVVAVPLMLSASADHRLAGELHLRPLLSELGATVPAPTLALLEGEDTATAAEQAWLDRWGPVVRRQCQDEADPK